MHDIVNVGVLQITVTYFASLICTPCYAVHVVVTWRIQKAKKKVHHFPGKRANTSPRETTGALNTPEMCAGTLDSVMCTEMKQGWHKLKRAIKARWRSFP